MKKIVSKVLLTLLLMDISTLAFNVQPVKADYTWSATIYIRGDGSIEPADAPISTVDSITYTLTDNIVGDVPEASAIVVQRNNIVVDGAGYSVQGTGSGTGINLTARGNVTIKNTEVNAFSYGIYLESSSSCDLSKNSLANNTHGFYLKGATNNNISQNNAADNVWGIELWYSSNNTLSENSIRRTGSGIRLYDSSYNIISRNNMTDNTSTSGISLTFARHNIIFGNNITNNPDGIRLYDSSNNSITENNITNNGWGPVGMWGGIRIRYEFSNNSIYHNRFINNKYQVVFETSGGYTNFWDNGYPSGGNYWSDHVTVDDYSGIDQDESGSDGIVDEPYIIDYSNRDNFPFKGPISFFNAGTWDETTYYVHTVSNSTVSGFYFNPDEGAMIRFNVTGVDGTPGFSRVAIPKELLWVENGWVVLVDDEPVVPTVTEDADFTYLYFTYSHSTRTVEIQGTNVIPEFPTWIPLLLLLSVISVTLVIYKRRLLKTPPHQRHSARSKGPRS